MNMRIRVGLWVMLLLLVAPLQASNVTVQKWVDAAGNVHFGDQPPNSARPEEMVIKTFGPSAPAAGAQAANKGDAKKPAEDSEACKAAQKQLADYERAPFLYETDADGKRHILPDEQRQQLLDGVKERVKTDCGG